MLLARSSAALRRACRLRERAPKEMPVEELAVALPDISEGVDDIPAFRQSLAELWHRVDEAQAKVAAMVDPTHTEYMSACAGAGPLRKTVDSLARELRSVVRSLLGPVTRDDGEPVNGVVVMQCEPPHVAYTCVAARDRDALSKEVDAMDNTVRFLMKMLQVQDLFKEFDEMATAARYCDAAELSIEVAKMLESVVGFSDSVNSATLSATRTSCHQRRAVLATRLEDILRQLCAFGDRSAAAKQSASATLVEGADVARASPPTTLREIWDAFAILGLRDRYVEQLAGQARHIILCPLLDAARQLPPGRTLKPWLHNPTPDTVTWTWVDAPEDLEVENIAARANVPTAIPGMDAAVGKPHGTLRRLPPAHVVLQALESLLTFAYANWAGSANEVYFLLGEILWPPIARDLLRHFDTCGADGGEALERFEIAMFRKGFIGNAVKTLTRHVHEQRHGIGEQRRASLVAEARASALKEDLTSVQVCDADEPGSVTQLLRQAGAGPSEEIKLKSSNFPIAPQATNDFVVDQLRFTLGDDEGFLRLPTMSISMCAHRLVAQMRGLMVEVTAAAEQGRAELADDLNKLVRQLVTLFLMLRPHAQKVQLRASPQRSAYLLTDCMYISHALLLMPHTYGQQLPDERKQLALFVDLVPQLRRLGESSFHAMLQHQQEQTIETLKPCDFSAGIVEDRVFIAADTAVRAAMQHVRAASQGLSAALPDQLLREVTGKLLGTVCKDLLLKLFRERYDPDPLEVGCVSMLLVSAVAMGRQILVAAGVVGSGGDKDLSALVVKVPGWSQLSVAADLLGSSYERFLRQRSSLLRVLKKDEVLKLLHMSLRGRNVSPRDAWSALSAGARA